MNHQQQYKKYITLIEEGLERFLPHSQIPQIRLLDAMTYSLLAGGKRIRPVLTLAFCNALNGSLEAALPFACAIEMIHTYSLIHDDLPCMDNDDIRRGRPSNHMMFGEAGALLAGDALLTAAFETVLDADYYGDIPPKRVVSAAHRMAWASGLYGMAGGQQLDLDADSLEPSIETASQICLLKTGMLIDAAAAIGCELADGTREQMLDASSFARCLGLAFQIKDDLLDLEGDSVKMGRASGADPARGKITFASLLGTEECRRLIKELTDNGETYLASFPNNDFLIWLGRELMDRDS